MNIVIDVGNTTIAVGLFDQREILDKRIFGYHKNKDREALRNFFYDTVNDFKKSGIERVFLSSVVPETNFYIINAIRELLQLETETIPVGYFGCIKNKIPYPETLGNDLLCDLVGVAKLYETPMIIIDLGTAIKFLVLEEGNVFRYCSLLPGLKVSIDALTNNASLLEDTVLQAPKTVLNGITSDCINAGVIYGNVDLVEGMTRRYERELGYKCKHIVTGGDSALICKYLDESFIHDSDLTLKGINELFLEMK